MLTFNCTKGAQDFFTVTRKGQKQTIVELPPSKDINEDAQHLQQWLLHAVSIRRKQFLVAVEVNTRFSVTMTGVKKADRDEFIALFKSYLSAQVLDFGQKYEAWDKTGVKAVIRENINHFAEERFLRRSDRSVQARINSIVQDLRYFAEDDPTLLTDEDMLLGFNGYQNRMLCKSNAFPGKSHVTPNEEMLIVWQRLYQGATDQQIEKTRQKIKENLHLHVKAVIDDLEDEFKDPDEPPTFIGTDALIGESALTKSDLAFLEQVLQKYQTEFSPDNLSTLHGFMTAIVSGPNMLPPSFWLPELWGGESLMPQWEDISEVERFMNALFTMMNHIVSTLMASPQRFSAIFIGDEHSIDVCDWCFGYIDAVDLDIEAWGGLPDHLMMKLDFIDDLAVESARFTGEEREALRDQIIGIAEDIHAYWIKQRSPLPSGGTQPIPDNLVPLRPQQPVTSMKVGRNEPCPCGSGKKFKKCCLH